MKVIEKTRIYPVDITIVWKIISNLSRSDWVPGVERITLKEDTRIFEMQGMGDLVERIITVSYTHLTLPTSDLV